MRGKWNIPSAEIERRRKEKGMRLCGFVTEHRQSDGKVFYTVRSESEPAKHYRITWDQLRGRWACPCPDSQHHQATQYYSYRCAHLWAIELALARGTIHGIDSLVAARQRYQNGGAKDALRGMTAEQGRQNVTGVSRRRKSTRGRR